MTIAADRRDRIGALAFDYAAEPKRRVERCNLCGASTFVVMTHRDRYGFPAQAVACDGCGLVFLDPVMTAEAYGRFYAGTYRPLVSAYHGRLIDARTIQAEQLDYAAERGDLLAPFFDGRGYRTLLDIGGSTGVVAHALSLRFGLKATVVDPAPLEAAEARGLGIETIDGLVESVDLGSRRFDVIAICQTIDHLLDIDGTLRRVRELITDNGLFFVDIVDLRAGFLRHWSVEEAVKIDHPYYLTESTMTAWLRRRGFRVVRSDYAADHLHVSYVTVPSDADPAALPPAADVRDLLREVRFVQNVRR